MSGIFGLGTLVAPDYNFWTADRRRSWLNQINEQVRAMDNDIDTNRSRILAATGGQRFISDFDAFQARWLAYNSSVGTWFSGVADSSQQYVNEYNALEARYRSLTGTAPTSAFTASEAERPSALRAANYTLMAWAGLGILGLGTLGYVLSNWARIRTISKLANNRGRRRRRASRRLRSNEKRAKMSELGVWTAIGKVREVGPTNQANLILPPGVAAQFKRMPPGLYKYGWGPKKGASFLKFTSAGLRGAMASTRIGAAKVGENHWLVDNFDPKFPVVIRGIDDHGRTFFRVEEYAKELGEPAYAEVRRTSKRTSR